MAYNRNRFGIGPIWSIIAIGYSLLAIYINNNILDKQKITFLPDNILFIIGIIMLVLGLIILMKAITVFNKAYNHKILKNRWAIWYISSSIICFNYHFNCYWIDFDF